jgi:hypothetical protein
MVFPGDPEQRRYGCADGMPLVAGPLASVLLRRRVTGSELMESFRGPVRSAVIFYGGGQA